MEDRLTTITVFRQVRPWFICSQGHSTRLVHTGRGRACPICGSTEVVRKILPPPR